MKRFTSFHKERPSPGASIRRWARRVVPALFWLAVWQAASFWVDQELLLVSPIRAGATLLRLMGTRAFYGAVLNSFGRIALGFLLAVSSGTLLAALSKAFPTLRALLSVPMKAIKATPVASFVILALIWLSSQSLSIFTSFLMVLPAIYENVLEGLEGADKKLMEMARSFQVPLWGKVRAIYASAAFPFFLSACRVSLGMCWKAGIAAEVIGQPKASIGDALYRAKLFLSTDELFAWTLAIIFLSILIERLAVAAISRLMGRIGGGQTDAD